MDTKTMPRILLPPRPPVTSFASTSDCMYFYNTHADMSLYHTLTTSILFIAGSQCSLGLY